jgi:hypothetical protein
MSNRPNSLLFDLAGSTLTLLDEGTGQAVAMFSRFDAIVNGRGDYVLTANDPAVGRLMLKVDLSGSGTHLSVIDIALLHDPLGDVNTPQPYSGYCWKL